MTEAVTMLISRFPPHVGGTENQAFRLARRLVKSGWDVDVVTQRHAAALPRTETMDGVRVVRVGWPVPGFVGSLSFFCHGLRHLLKKTSPPRVFHAHMIAAPAVLACLAGALLGVPVIVKLACSGFLGDIASANRTWFGRRKLAFVLNRTARFISLSEEVSSELLRERVPADRIVLISNGVDTAEFPMPPDKKSKAEWRAHLGLADGRWILFSGRITQQKRPLDLLEAFQRVSRVYPDSRLLYIGEGDQRAALIGKIRELGLSDRVEVRSTQHTIAAYYQAADVFVLASEGEGMSNSLLEAMSSGLICVASRVGSNAELLTDGVNGFLFSGDTAALTETLSRALNGADAVGARARQTVEDRYGLDAVTARYIGVYGDLKRA